jgi:hypothetical protein
MKDTYYPLNFGALEPSEIQRIFIKLVTAVSYVHTSPTFTTT